MANIGSASWNDEPFGYKSTGSFIRSIEAGEYEYEVDHPSAPGVDGSGSKNYGFRKQEVTIGVTYIAGSSNQCYKLADDDNFAISGITQDAVLGGVTMKAVWLLKFKTQTPRSTGLGTYRMNAEITIMATRLP